MSIKSRPPARTSRRQVPHRLRPEVERLEQRDCPAGPTITNFAGQIVSDGTVVLTGNITDSGQNAVALSISGAGSASAKVGLDSYGDGEFRLTLDPVDTSGTFFAQAVDSASDVSPQVQTTAGNGPTLTLGCNQQGGHQVRVTGTLGGAAPGGVTINFSGVISGSTTTTSSGYFSYTATASALGGITATAAVGGYSATAQTALTNQAPVITSFLNGTSGNSWTFQGSVLDEWAMGLTVSVTAPGLSSPLQAVVGSDDCFSVSATLSGPAYGSATAQTIDWWGAASNVAYSAVRTGNL
jgi:hypothetical protein